ncbi:MAG: glycosyltransferase family 39 protein [Planctomycetes bacterium]|nr:glycosyltransferase family 39 protein [Planctomycetota bacterium]
MKSAAATQQPGPIFGGWYFLIPIVALALARGFWAPDEPRYAEIAKEAWQTPSFLVLHLCGELYPDKPPLVYWLAGLMGQLSGWSEFWMRTPSILATVGSAYLCARIARRWLGEHTARWSVPFYLGTIMLLEIGGRLQLDPLLAFFCLLAIDLLTNTDGAARALQRRTLLAGLALGFGALAKGPPAWLPAGFALVTWALLPRDLRFAPRRRLATWIGFVVLAILPVATWATLAIRAEPALMKPLLFGQHVGRITSGDQHPGPIWDHLRSFPVLFLPWTLLLAAGLGRAWRSFRARENTEFVRIAAWFAVVFVFWSVIPPKRDLYLLPIYPAAALIAAFEFTSRLRAGSLPRWIGWTTAGLLGLVGLVLASATLVVPRIVAASPNLFTSDAEAAELALRIVPAGLALLAGVALAGWALSRGRIARWADAIGLGLASALTLVAVLVVPRIDDVKSARSLAELLAQRPEKPSLLACVGIRPEGIRFYGNVPAGADPIPEALEREGANFLALCRDKEFQELPDAVKARVREIAKSRVGSRVVYVLVRADP